MVQPSKKKKVLVEAKEILGLHPQTLFGCHTEAHDGHTKSKVPHRACKMQDDKIDQTIAQLRPALVKHHADDRKVARIKHQLERLGFDHSKLQTPIPQTETTRKGNLAEVFLAEYISASANSELPVYRLRFNPNVEQSMKGDDVLAFDFSKDPVRILVGEAKFRGTSSKAAVQQMIQALLSSHRVGIPSSLQFVADRLFEMGRNDLGERIEKCVVQLAHGKHDLRYVGLIMSTGKCKAHVDQYAEAIVPNLAVLSFASNSLREFFEACYDHIEEETFGSSK